MEFRDLKKQYQVLKPKMDQAILEVMESAQFIGGSKVKELEERLASYVGVKHCITCGNGTDALTMVLKAWGISEGDAVFIPSFTFFASAEVVSFEGATPVFVDVDRDRFNRKKFTTVDSSKGKEAISNVTLLRQIGEYALVKVNIITGRTHQIRVHLSSLNYPIVGDPLYSRTKGDMMLHALSLQFNDPVSGKKLTFRAPLPKSFVERVKSLSDNTRM
jgi:hypothetical protein